MSGSATSGGLGLSVSQHQLCFMSARFLKFMEHIADALQPTCVVALAHTSDRADVFSLVIYLLFLDSGTEMGLFG